MRGEGGSCGLAGSQPMSTAVQRSPNKLWRSNSIFNQWQTALTISYKPRKSMQSYVPDPLVFYPWIRIREKFFLIPNPYTVFPNPYSKSFVTIYRVKIPKFFFSWVKSFSVPVIKKIVKFIASKTGEKTFYFLLFFLSWIRDPGPI
jgi:hypothetical protein